MIDKKNLKLLLRYLLLGGIILATLSFSGSLQADIDCNGKCDSKCSYYLDEEEKDDCLDKCKDDCKALEKKENAILQSLQVVNKTQSILNEQIENLNQQQSTNQQSLNKVLDTLTTLSEKIEYLKRDIAEQEKKISYQKKLLTGLLQTYYDYDQQGILEFVLWEKDLSATMSQKDHIQHSSLKISDVLNEIKENQAMLERNKQELESDFKKSDELKEKLEYEKNNLQSTENQKAWLLQKTEGEEEKYQQMLAHIEEQKRQLLDFSGASNISELFASLKNYPKPDKKYHASTSWYFAQTDSRWANQRIGNSKSLMKDWGCAVTCVAMAFRKYGSGTDPGKLAKEKIFYGDLIAWPASWSPGITRISSISHGNINWTTVKNEIDKGHPVIVYIKRTSGGGGHYVLITGKDSKDYVVHDPYFGANLYLNTSKSLVGKIGSNSNTTIDQMIIYKK